MLLIFVILNQTQVTWKDGNSIQKLPPTNYPEGIALRDCPHTLLL